MISEVILHRICAYAMCAVAVASCFRQQDTAVPRPTAYPRIALCDTVYTIADIPALHFEINAQAVLITDRIPADRHNMWFDVYYPTYRATLHCTLTPVNDSVTYSNILSNRIERIALNTGGKDVHTTEIANPYGYNGRIYTSPYIEVTPVQFLATGAHNVISGAVMFDTPVYNPDSLLPVITAIERDVVHTLTHMY